MTHKKTLKNKKGGQQSDELIDIEKLQQFINETYTKNPNEEKQKYFEKQHNIIRKIILYEKSNYIFQNTENKIAKYSKNILVNLCKVFGLRHELMIIDKRYFSINSGYEKIHEIDDNQLIVKFMNKYMEERVKIDKTTHIKLHFILSKIKKLYSDYDTYDKEYKGITESKGYLYGTYDTKRTNLENKNCEELIIEIFNEIYNKLNNDIGLDNEFELRGNMYGTMKRKYRDFCERIKTYVFGINSTNNIIDLKKFFSTSASQKTLDYIKWSQNYDTFPNILNIVKEFSRLYSILNQKAFDCDGKLGTDNFQTLELRYNGFYVAPYDNQYTQQATDQPVKPSNTNVTEQGYPAQGGPVQGGPAQGGRKNKINTKKSKHKNKKSKKQNKKSKKQNKKFKRN